MNPGEDRGDIKLAAIIEAANKNLFGGTLPAFYENIIVVDDGEYWCVSYHLKGNGRIISKEGIEGNLAFIHRAPKNIIYLYKNDLTPATRVGNPFFQIAPSN